ncbi:nuclear transport factor 2 family protein [Nocardia salmonicida]|uniref:nuclear transport factor 2 family protein n=1 Tax=Nocardia salmonicida TaxID=53431 RepID=UPI00366A6CC1
MSPTPEEIRELWDKQALLELVLRVSRAVDRCDGELLLSCYWDDAVDDHGVYKGNVRGLLEHLRKKTMVPTNGPIQHAITNALFEIRGEVAFGESYGESRNVEQDGAVTLALARYVDRFERRDGEWRIIQRRVILESARPGFDRSHFTMGSRDRSDPSYERE